MWDSWLPLLANDESVLSNVLLVNGAEQRHGAKSRDTRISEDFHGEQRAMMVGVGNFFD